MLTVRNISASYAKKEVLHNISLSFAPQKIYTIIGKNGSGKSSLLKSIIGLMTLQNGVISIDNVDLHKMAAKERAQHISYLSQHRNISDISVEQLVTHGRYPYMIGNETYKTMRHSKTIQLAIEKMNLTEHKKTPLRNLSGGEIQRAYIAMILAQDTPIVLFDEPTTFIDIAYQMQFLQLVKELKAAQKTIILVLHDIPSAFEISDEIILMEQGEIKCVLPPQELLCTDNIARYFHVDIRYENDYYFVVPLST